MAQHNQNSQNQDDALQTVTATLKEARERLRTIVSGDGNRKAEQTLELIERAIAMQENDAIHDELECVLCSKLLFNPVSTPCGHTFCRACLARSLDHATTCPMCREPLHFSANHPVNVTLNNLLHKLYPNEATERAKEEKELHKQVTESLPLFVLNSICAPGQDFRLHIFEPRYRLMIRRCMAGPKQFGLVNCVQNAAGDWELCSVGTCLKIEQVQMLADGRSLVSTKGTQRFRILSSSDLDGYKVGKIEWINDDPKEVGQVEKETQLMETLTAKLTQLFHSVSSGQSSCGGLKRLVDSMREEFGAMPNTPDEFSWWLVSALPVGGAMKSALLQCKSTLKRLELVEQLLMINPHSSETSQQDGCSLM